jgi:rubrerythrin
VKGPSAAIELGRKAEMDSIRFYRAAEKACTHPGGKAAFEALIEEEEEHLRLLTELRDKLPLGPRGGLMAGRVVYEGRLRSPWPASTADGRR